MLGEPHKHQALHKNVAILIPFVTKLEVLEQIYYA